MTENNERPDSAVLIVVLTAVSYALAFTYEASYLGHFGVPAAFVEVGLRGLLLCAGAIFSLSFLVLWLGLVIRYWPTHLPPVVQFRLAKLFVIAMGFAILNFAFNVGDRERLISLGILFLIAFWDFVLPVVRYRNYPTYIEKLRAADEVAMRPTPADTLFGKLGRRNKLIAVFLLFGFLVVFILGMLRARIETDFMVVEDCVVLRVQGDTLLCAAVQGKNLTGEYAYLPAQGTAMTRQRIGPLERYQPDRSKAASAP